MKVVLTYGVVGVTWCVCYLTIARARIPNLFKMALDSSYAIVDEQRTELSL